VAVEIERKFLVPEAPGADELARYESHPIQQGYLAVGEDGSEARLRLIGDNAFLTVKSGGLLSRAEYEVPLSSDQFVALWPATEGRRLLKRRYRIALDVALTAELDIYGGALEGLAVVEVEFPDQAAAEAFIAPAWFGDDVTGDQGYRNHRLAVERPPVRNTRPPR
jgi:adenylate cyclase